MIRNGSRFLESQCVGAFIGGLLLALSGCATQPAGGSAAAPTTGDKSTASQLYAGQPSIVHATEYPVASAAEGIERGDEAWRQGKLDLAVYLYVQSLAFDSTSAEPFLRIGTIHEQRGNRALAEKAYELALERQPKNPAACERLALLYIQGGRNDDARMLFERALDLQSDRWRSHDGLGILADRRQDHVAAIGHYDRALALEPRAASVMNNRGYSRFLAGDPVGAETDLKEAIRLGAGDGAWTNLGKVQASQARYAEALQSFLNEMDMPHAYNLLGVVAMQRSDDLLAKKYFESASRASPRYFEAAQRNLSIVNERLASTMPVAGARVVTSETDVYSNETQEVRVGVVRRGDQVQVLEARLDRSRIKFKASDGDDGHVGWVPSAALAERL
jgi:Flp pilus assembly protein TadD